MLNLEHGLDQGAQIHESRLVVVARAATPIAPLARINANQGSLSVHMAAQGGRRRKEPRTSEEDTESLKRLLTGASKSTVGSLRDLIGYKASEGHGRCAKRQTRLERLGRHEDIVQLTCRTLRKASVEVIASKSKGHEFEAMPRGWHRSA